MLKKFWVITLTIFLIATVNAFSYDNPTLPRLTAPTPTTITFNNNSGSVNDSLLWDGHAFVAGAVSSIEADPLSIHIDGTQNATKPIGFKDFIDVGGNVQVGKNLTLQTNNWIIWPAGTGIFSDGSNLQYDGNLIPFIGGTSIGDLTHFVGNVWSATYNVPGIGYLSSTGGSMELNSPTGLIYTGIGSGAFSQAFCLANGNDSLGNVCTVYGSPFNNTNLVYVNQTMLNTTYARLGSANTFTQTQTLSGGTGINLILSGEGSRFVMGHATGFTTPFFVRSPTPTAADPVFAFQSNFSGSWVTTMQGLGSGRVNYPQYNSTGGVVGYLAYLVPSGMTSAYVSAADANLNNRSVIGAMIGGGTRIFSANASETPNTFDIFPNNITINRLPIYTNRNVTIIPLNGTTNGFVVADSTGLLKRSASTDNLTMGNLTVNNLIVGTNAVVIGNVTENQFYGEMWFHNDTVANVTIISSTTSYFNVTAFNGQQSGQDLNGFSYSTNALTTNVAGKYKADYCISFSGGTNDKYHFVLANNGVELPQSEEHSKLGTAGDIANVCGTSFINLAVGNVINLQVQDETATSNINVFSANVNLLRIGT